MTKQNPDQNQRIGPKEKRDSSKTCLWIAVVVLGFILVVLVLGFFGFRYFWRKAEKNINSSFQNLNSAANENSDEATLSKAAAVVEKFEQLNQRHNDANARAMLDLFTEPESANDKEMYDYLTGADSGGIWRLFATAITSYYQVSAYEIVSKEIVDEDRVTIKVKEKTSYYDNTSGAYSAPRDASLIFELLKDYELCDSGDCQDYRFLIDKYHGPYDDDKYSGFIERDTPPL